MKTLSRCLGTWTLLLLYSFSPWSRGKLVPQNFEEKLIALYKVINYIHQRPHQMNVDATFSVTIAEANTAAALLHENVRYLEDKHHNMLVTIFKLCVMTRRNLMRKVIPEDEDSQLLQKTLNHPVLWMKPILWRRGALEKGKMNRKSTCWDVRELVMQGTPKEKENDRCLTEIIRSRLNSNYRIPDFCFKILTDSEFSRGYPLTHRLFIVQVASVMECDLGFPTTELILSYCSAILQDLTEIESAGFPYQTADLMMEQVVLCGMEGFLEFTDAHYERLVLDWSHPSGCYSSFGNKFSKNGTRVSRRASSQTDFGCDNHATGLAAASLSLFIRENLENAGEQTSTA
ncbi:uncharacterized protein LOC108629392 [Ceratina calcarata]|uniref:Uncharacterized protein LOC108629392 n=1 Tax=Ceratina calcarata TaxID=156304 RepID=A0AAJ7J8V5_9HYME|nr:uncharacterized protein LOC108629392 [Ceratina calcarata]